MLEGRTEERATTTEHNTDNPQGEKERYKRSCQLPTNGDAQREGKSQTRGKAIARRPPGTGFPHRRNAGFFPRSNDPVYITIRSQAR